MDIACVAGGIVSVHDLSFDGGAVIQKRSRDEVFEFSLYWYTILPATQARIMGKKSTLQQSENYEVKYTPLPEIK